MVTLRPEVTEHGAKGIPSRAQGLANSLCVEVRKAAEPACVGQAKGVRLPSRVHMCLD